jgi:hypothetical protein
MSTDRDGLRTIIAGSREVTELDVLTDIIRDRVHWDISVVLSGGCRGVDELGEKWATENDIPVEKFPADWEQFGDSAGPIRNSEMADSADALVAIKNNSPNDGTSDMIQKAESKDLLVVEENIDSVDLTDFS